MHRLHIAKRSLRYAAIVLTVCSPVRTATLNSRPAMQPTRPHITGIDYVRVYVSHIDKSGKVYSDVLGLTAGCPQSASGVACCLVRAGAQRFRLKPAPMEAAKRTLRNLLADLAFSTDNLKRMRVCLRANQYLRGAIQKYADG